MLSWSIINKMLQMVLWPKAFSIEMNWRVYWNLPLVKSMLYCVLCELSTNCLFDNLPLPLALHPPHAYSFWCLMGAFVNQMWIWHTMRSLSQCSQTNFHEYSHINDNQSSCSHSSIVAHFHTSYVCVCV